MLRKAIYLAVLLCAARAWGQQYIPTPGAAFFSSNGTLAGPWSPATGSGGTAVGFIPGMQIGIFYSTTGALAGPWAPCTSTCFGGGGGSGTVTSVTFTGDGVLDSSTPSTAVTTSGTVAATAKSFSANTVVAGPTSGSAAPPTARALVAADLPSVPCSDLPALTGDTTSSAGSCATTVVQVEGAAIPTSATFVGTNSSKQLIAAPTPGYNIGGLVTWSGCTYSAGVCTVVTPGATITISAIPGTFLNLQAMINGQSSSSSNNSNVDLTFNSDTGNNYNWALWYGGEAGSGAGSGTSVAFMQVGNLPSSSAAGSIYSSPIEIFIQDYAGTTFGKSSYGRSAQNYSAGITTLEWNGMWKNATPAAITTMTISATNGNFTAGSTFKIYGTN